MAHDRKLEVAAEGVETEPQQTLLLDQDCDLLQGDLYAGPLPADALEPLLQRGFHLVPRGLPVPRPAHGVS
jgi:EAL domain-containing protein (putative c-di-GMP-specific phosphodiesterase class I)